VLAIARKNSPDAMRTLVACMNDTEAPWATRIQAATALLDRGWGRPAVQDQQLDGERSTGPALIKIQIVHPEPFDGEAVTIAGPFDPSQQENDVE